MIPGSPVFPHQPLTPRHFNQVYFLILPREICWLFSLYDLSILLNQMGSFRFPPNHSCPSTPLAPKVMQLRFGANSPRPSSFYSPSLNSVEPFGWVVVSLRFLLFWPGRFENSVSVGILDPLSRFVNIGYINLHLNGSKKLLNVCIWKKSKLDVDHLCWSVLSWNI